MSASPITVAFRYDDYSELSATNVEKRLIETFQNFKVSCLFGVIPFVVDERASSDPVQPSKLGAQKTALLREAIASGAVEAALHGYSHRNLAPQGERPTEFSGLNLSAQRQRVAEGKQYLEEALSTMVQVFIPPWNSYDSDTVRALEDAGFDALSAGLHIGSARRDDRLKFIPNTGGLLDVKQAVLGARYANTPSPLIVIMLHPYDFHESGARNSQFDFSDLEQALAWLKGQPDVAIASFRSLLTERRDIDSARYIENRNIQKFRLITPLFLRRYGLRGVYLSIKDAIHARWIAWAYVFLFYGALLSISAFASSGMVSLFLEYVPMDKAAMLIVTSLITIGFFFYVMLRRPMKYTKAVFLAIVLGLYLGVMFQALSFGVGRD